MNVIDAASEIRKTVSMDSILHLYGYHPKHGFMPCPFHGERNGSLRVYSGPGKGWHCFGCGRGGSVIDFVMEHEGCNFRTAVEAINNALGLDLLGREDPLEMTHRQIVRQWAEGIAAAWIEYADSQERTTEAMLAEMTREIQDIEAIPKEQRSADQWEYLLETDDYMQYLEDRKRNYEWIRREVKEWLRKQLRVR